MSRIAVVLFNLGGPDKPQAVQPFLFNLFNDPAIIGAPGPVRWCLAKFISKRRAPVAQEIYRELGGGSPLLPNTEAQAAALEAVLNRAVPEDVHQVFIAMRYWHPFSDETAAEVKSFAPDEILLLPLYPQYLDHDHRGSSVEGLAARCRRQGGSCRSPSTTALCCYPRDAGFTEAVAERLRTKLAETKAAKEDIPLRVLFSAHGLPKKVVAGGDPYQWQVEQSAAQVVEALGEPDLDWLVCYQSRVGPLEWIGPSTEEEIARAGRDGVALLVVPIAFVSEHSETLVELDIEYAKLAQESGVPAYHRVPTADCETAFIEGLAALALEARQRDLPLCTAGGTRVCPPAHGRCAMGEML